MPLNRIGTLTTNGKSFYQSVSGGAQPSTLTSIWNLPSTDSDSPDSAQDTLQFRLSDDESFHQLEAAVNSALDAAQQDPTADPNQIIGGAIQQAFRTTALTHSKSISNSGTSNLDSAESGAADRANSNTSSAARQRYLQTLRGYGVEPQQFHGDLVNAVMDAQHGHVDPSTVFRHFPLGASLDAVA